MSDARSSGSAVPAAGVDYVPIGYAGLVAAYHIECSLPRRALAIAIRGGRRRMTTGLTEWTLLPRGSSIRLPAGRIGHLGIALKHEPVDPRILARLFEGDIADELAGWIEENPDGQYTRRAWFLFEWLSGRRLPVTSSPKGKYISVLDETAYFTRTPVRSPRHKVMDNMPGVPGFCPVIRRTERLSEQRFAAMRDAAQTVVSHADPAVLRRAVAYLLLNESKGSFGIEGEVPPRTRLERWGAVVAAAGSAELSIAQLEALQRSLFDGPAWGVRLGLRQAGGFVGRHDRETTSPMPDHISAHERDVRPLLQAMLDAVRLLQAAAFPPILAATLSGFGFVFIHPF